MTNEPAVATGNGADTSPESSKSLLPQQQAQQMQIDPVQTAQAALMFLERADHKRAERAPFDACVVMLSAIARGEVQLVQAPRPAN